ncbi:flagellar biosynthetic protein FliR [Cupriavidus basilensis]|uniref:Flagellar biosynthetic protein FliR n=1 Tax=Cupriavidus basilensis TaxID=68895 RepID=A0ABT6AW37_9BURK|nr:flagellar biosynthetic protein FliR [Cupriavidus basilensis]
MVAVPARVRILLALAMSACLAAGVVTYPSVDMVAMDNAVLVRAMGSELLIGISIALVLQLCFAALYIVGRTIDIQAGYGLALLIDPTTRAQTPLFGTMFALLAGIVFFAINGHHDLLRLVAASLEFVPLGAQGMLFEPERIFVLLGGAMTLALGIGAALMATLFAADVGLALLSRALPQMNVLILGLQVKGILAIVVGATSMLFTAPRLVELVRMMFRFFAG